MQTYIVKVIKKEMVTDTMCVLTLSKPEGFEYSAGQFVQLLVPDGEKNVKRAYSIASKPEDQFLLFCIKILPDGKASEMIKKIVDGETLEITHARGRFINDKQSSLYFIATGAGIAPIRGMIEDELKTKANTKSIRLLFGLRHQKDLFWQEYFEKLAEQHPNFTYSYTLSQPESSWDGPLGRVTKHLINPEKEAHYFLCGSAPMVKDVRTVLIEAGVPASQIHFEIF